MTDDLVDTRAHAFWETAIVEGRRIGIPLDTFFMTYPVQLVGCYSRSDVRSRRLEDFPCQLLSADVHVYCITEKAGSSLEMMKRDATYPADLLHAFNLLLSQDLHRLLADHLDR